MKSLVIYCAMKRLTWQHTPVMIEGSYGREIFIRTEIMERPPSQALEHAKSEHGESLLGWMPFDE